MTKKSGIFYYIRIGGALLLICAFMAGLVAGVHALTEDKINAYNENKRSVAFREFFPETASSKLSEKTSDTVNGIYELYSADGTLIGYAVDASAAGYGGLVKLMVGITIDGKVQGISVISHAETKGLTSSETAGAYFAQFKGRTGELKLGNDIDAMSGATISSKAVLKAVEAALALKLGEEAE